MSEVDGLTREDAALIEAARDVIRRNYDADGERHTVGCALRCGNGHVYAGVNLYDIHGACAEVVTMGMAATAGEREFACIVAVRGAQGEEILPPCGNCRQVLADYAPDCEVILPGAAEPHKMTAQALLPEVHLVYPEPYRQVPHR
jgi:cytidine deaminase